MGNIANSFKQHLLALDAPAGGESPSGSVRDFVSSYAPLAERIGKRLQVDPSILMAQWGLETGWGKSIIPGTNNLGNIKDFSGRGVGATDNMTGSRDNYRAYASADSFGDDFASLLERRYGSAVGAGADPKRYAMALQSGGYAEDPQYVEKITGLTEQVRAARGGTVAAGTPDTQSAGLVSHPESGFMTEGFRATEREKAEARRQELIAQGPELSDFGKAFTASMVRGFGDLARGLVLEPLATAMNYASGVEDFQGFNPLEGASDWIRETMTEAGKVASADVPEGNAFDPSTWKLPDTTAGVLMLAADGFGSLVPSIAPVIGPARRAQKLYAAAKDAEQAGNAVKASALMKQAQNAQRVAQGVGAAAGFGMAGGAGAGEAREGVESAMAEMTHDELVETVPIYAETFQRTGSQDQARKAVSNTAAQLAGVMSGAAGGMGGVINAKLFTDWLADRGITAALRGVSSNWAGRGVAGGTAGAIGEGFQETLEGVGVNAAENIALGRPAAEDLGRDTFADALGGALVGGPVGAVGGATSRGGNGAAPTALDPTTPLSNAAAAGALAGASSADQNALVAQPEVSQFDQRMDRVASFVGDKEFIRGVRGASEFGAESVSELLSAYAKARNPNVDDVVRNKALSDIEQFIDAFVRRPNFTMQGDGDGTSVVPVRAERSAVDQASLSGPAFAERDITPRPASPAPADRRLQTEQAMRERREADAAYEQAYQDLVKAEQLGASDAELMEYQRALQELEALRNSLDERLAEIGETLDARLQMDELRGRDELLDALLADPDTQNPRERFEAELKRQGSSNPAVTEAEAAKIARFEDARAAQPQRDDTAPNEFDPYEAPRERAAQPRAGNKAGEVKSLVDDGWRLNQRALVSPTGKRRNLNAVEYAAAKEAQRKARAEAARGPIPQSAIEDAQAAVEAGANGSRRLDPLLVVKARRWADDLRAMAQDAGWAEVGGQLVRASDGSVSRTAWIPRADWFRSGMEPNERVLMDAIERIIRGQFVVARPRRTVEGMIEWLEAQVANGQIDEDSSSLDMEAVGYEDLLPEVREALDAEFAEISEAEAMFALGFTQEEINEALATSTGTEAQVRGDDAGSAAADEGVGEGLALSSYSPEELAEREQQRVSAEQAESDATAEAERRAQADAERDSFTLTGSDRSADILSAQGQSGLFDASVPQETYNERVAREERDIESRRRQGDRIVRQANGKPFRTRKTAEHAQRSHGLIETHDIAEVDGGFELRLLTPADLVERQRVAAGLPSYVEAQEAVLLDMGIEDDAQGNVNATDEQWAEVDRRVDAILRDGAPMPKPREDAQVRQAVAKAEAETDGSPSEAQKEAGNYAKGKLELHGQTIAIETPVGAERSGVGINGEPWSVTMPASYGYISDTKSADGEQVDVFVGPTPESKNFWIINQTQPGKEAFDEPKVMMGFESAEDAQATYLLSFSDDFGAQVFGDIVGPFNASKLSEILPSLEKKVPAQGPVVHQGTIEGPLYAGRYDRVVRSTDTSGWSLLGENAEGRKVFAAGGIRLVQDGEYQVIELAHKPETQRYAEFKTADEASEAFAAARRGALENKPSYDEGVAQDTDTSDERRTTGRNGNEALERVPSAEDRGSEGSGDVRVPRPQSGNRSRRADPVADAGGNVADGGRGNDSAGLHPAAARAVTPALVPAENFVITDDVRLGQGGEVQKFNDNLAAIRIVKQMEAERRRATPEEQRQLARYVGWGGLASAFRNKQSGEFGKGWEARGSELEALLTNAELEAARATTTDAHYTSQTVVQAMWAFARRLGFDRGVALESSVGVGNFIGLMPEALRGAVPVVGVEVDSLTARIARALYPQSSILHSGFESVALPDNSFDLAIGNPPFGRTSLYFPHAQHLNGKSIHNQFFLGSLDAVRPGGLQIMVVSRYLMDAKDGSSRRELAEHADLIAAVRLPDNAFSENARTDVVTDILILRKHTAERAAAIAEEKNRPTPEWVGTTEIPDPLGGEPMTVNNYFASNPDMMLGVLERSGSMRFGADVTLRAREGMNLAEELAHIAERLPADLYTAHSPVEASIAQFEAMRESLELSIAGAEEGGVFFDADGRLTQVVARESSSAQEFLTRRALAPESAWSPQLLLDADGKWYREVPKLDADGKTVKEGRSVVRDRETFESESDVPATLRLGEGRYERMVALVRLRDRLKQQIVLETNDEISESLESNRSKLKAEYEAFIAKYGFVGDNANQSLLGTMPDGPLVTALEASYDPGVSLAKARRTGEKVRKASATPAPIMSERVVVPYVAPTSAESSTDALFISLSESGGVDLPRMASLLGVDEREVVRELHDEADSPLIFKDPETGAWETRDAYLSGPVVRKLAAARAEGLAKNVEALEAVQPEPIDPADIGVRIGATWVPADIYAEFLRRITGSPALVRFAKSMNTFDVGGATDGNESTVTWGTERMPAPTIFAAMLNSQTIAVYDPVYEGGRVVRRVLNEEQTALANQKADEISNEFADWIMGDPDRRERLAGIYNEHFNNRVIRQYDGSHLQLPGKVPDAVIRLRRHQKNGIWRGIADRFTLYDHAVGAGKTFTGIARAMERRRMGLSRKPMLTVPNHMVGQFAADVYRLYPGARMLALGQKDLEAKKRRRAFSRIATGDWDVVIVPHSSFGFIGIDPARESQYIKAEIEEVEAAIKLAAEEDRGDGWGKPQSVKTGEAIVKGLNARLQKITDKKRDRLLTFEQLGVDDLTVDEAHEFKNLMYHTRLTKVLGLGTQQGSKKAYDLFSKVRVLRESPRGSAAFMTGTPISNSIVEMYTLMRYLAADLLRDYGIDHFDAWHRQFADAVTKFELNDANQLEAKTRLARWSNMPELMKLYYSFADAVSLDDIKRWYAEDNNGKSFPVPRIKGGRRQNIIVAPTPAQVEILNEVVADFNGLRKIKDPKERNSQRLRLMDRARKVALDARAVDPNIASDEKGGKLDQAVDQMVRIYREWDSDKGTQLVFLDRSVPKAKGDDKIVAKYDKLKSELDAAVSANDESRFMEIQDELAKFDPSEMEALRAAQAGGWNAYAQIKRSLVERGVPENEIRFIQEANTDEQKQQIFDSVKSGAVRILIGSTQRMGAGTNVQDRIVGLHHIDVNWKPSDIEQREGRAERQGNLLLEKYGDEFEIEILAYATERTYDAKMWALNESKGRFINGLRQYNGEREVEIDDSDVENMAEMAAMASGDPMMLERVQLDAEVKKLELLRRAHNRRQGSIEDSIRRAERAVETLPAKIEAARRDERRVQDAIDAAEADASGRSVEIEGQTYSSMFEAAKAADAAIKDLKGGNERARFTLTVNGRPMTSRDAVSDEISASLGDANPLPLVVAGEHIRQRRIAGNHLATIAAQMLADGKETESVGEFFGMPLSLYVEGRPGRDRHATLSVRGEAVQLGIDIDPAEKTGAFSSAAMQNALANLGVDIKGSVDTSRMERELARAQHDLPGLKEHSGTSWQQQGEYDEKRARLEAVTAELAAKGGDSAPAVLRSVDDETASADGVVAVEEANRLIADFISALPGAPRIVSVPRFDALPADVREDAERQQGSEHSVMGVFNHRDESVYVVVGNHRTLADLEATLLHEVIGHYGMRQMFGADWIAKLNQVFIGLGGIGGLSRIMSRRGQHEQLIRYIEGARAAQRQSNGRMSEELVKALLTEEVFAHIAEQHGRKGLRDKFMEILGAIRQWLRDKGLFELASLGESDLVFMLSKARESMRTGETSVMRGPTVIGDEVVAASGRPLPAGDPDYDAAMRLADVLGLRTQPSTTVFSIRGDAAPIDRGNQRTALFSALAKFEDAFQQPTPKGDTLEVIAREIDPAYKVKRMPASLAREKTRGQAVKMWEIGTPRSTYRVGYVYEDDRGRVWIDVSRLVADEDSGTKFYGIVSGYARNTRKVFIGDPAGLSPVALFRRLENMISSALRYGSTDHLYPHGAQIDPEAYFEAEGYPDFAREVRGLGIDWREGDYSHNLTEMLKASYNAAVRFAPQIKDVVYDFDRQQFVDADSGERRDRRSFRDYVGRNGAEAPSRYRGGSATLARAALVNTLLRGQGKEAWSQVLDHVGAQLRGRGLDHELSEIFYQRTDAPVREGLTRDQFRAALVGRFGEVGVASLEAQGLLNIVEGSDSKNAAWYEPTTGTAYFVPERLATAEQAIAAVLHEVGEHHGLEAMLGSRGWRALKGRIAQLARGKNEVRAAWDGVLDLYPEFSDIAQLSPSEAIQNDRFVHEVIAKIGETAAGRKSGLWRDILAAINRFLLKAGLGRQINKNELADLVAGSLARVIRGDGPEPGPGGGDRMDQRQFELKDYLPGGARWSEPASGPYREQNRRIREEHITAWEKAKKWLKRQFTPGGLLPDSVFAEKIRRDSEFEVIEFDVRNLVGSLERAIKQDYGLEAVKVSEETQRLMSEMMAGRVDAGVPAATMDALLGMRQYIDKLSVEYLDILGQQISELAARAEAAKTNGEGDRIRAEALERIALYETIMGNVGEYVHRSYRAFDDPEWARNVPDAVLDAAREYLTARMAEDSETKAEDIPERVETILNQILKHGTAYESLEGFIKESKLGAKDLSVLKRRKQIAPEIRALLGEYPDPRIGFSKSATKMGRLIWNSRFLDRVREVGLGEFMWEEGKQPPEATTKMAADGSEVYAPLNGLWTTPEVAQAFKDALGKEQMADWYRTIVKINGMVKYGKTVLSPTTAARNWMSAFFFSIANGHFDMRHMAKSVEGLREYFTHAGEPEKLAYLRELKQLGVVYDTPYAGEMMRLLQDTNISETLAAGGGKRLGIKKALEMATKFYQYGDDFWKIIGFENEKQNWIKAGFSQQEAKERAAERVRNTYPTYSMVGRIIQSLRRFPLAGTFVSFPAEIIRTSTNMVKYIHEDWKDPRTRPMAVRRALGMAFVSGMAYGLQHLSMLMLGFDDDDDEAVRQMAAPWQKNSSFIFLGRDENGNLRYLDISFLDPYNYWKRPIMAVMRDQPVKDKVIDSIGEVTMPFLGADIAASSIFQVMANKRDTGSPVYREHDDTLDQALDIANHLRKALQPGLAANIERTWKAMSNEVTPSGRRYSIEDELAAWVGFRVSTLDPKVALYYRSFEFMDAKSQAERKLRDVIRDPGEVSIDELAGARDTTLRMRQHAFEQMHTLVQAARRSGLTNSDIVGSLRNAGVSAADAGMIVRGRVTPWSPNSSTVRQTANKARNTFGPEAGGRVMDRYRALAGMN